MAADNIPVGGAQLEEFLHRHELTADISLSKEYRRVQNKYVTVVLEDEFYEFILGVRIGSRLRSPGTHV